MSTGSENTSSPHPLSAQVYVLEKRLSCARSELQTLRLAFEEFLGAKAALARKLEASVLKNERLLSGLTESVLVQDLRYNLASLGRDLSYARDRLRWYETKLTAVEKDRNAAEAKLEQESLLNQRLRKALFDAQDRVLTLEKSLLAAQEQIKAHSDKAFVTQVSLDVEKNKTRVLGTSLAESVSKETWTCAATLDV